MEHKKQSWFAEPSDTVEDGLQQAWHAQPSETVAEGLNADVKLGLSSNDATIRLHRYGMNNITEHKGTGPFKRFMIQFHQPLVYILLAAVAVTMALGEWVDSAVIFMVVLLNAIIGFVQESKALQAINALSKSVKSTAIVIRDGNKISISAEQLVPGDLVVLQPGDKVSADMRLIKVKDLKIDESALTGESVATEKNSTLLPKDSVLGDRKNMAYSSTLVTYGTGLGLVTETGDATEIGKISTLITTTKTLDTPLTKRIAHFSHILLYAILILAGLTIFIGWLHGQPLIESFMAAVALAVGAIPEGLPAAVTIMLAIGVSRMAKRRAVIRNLPAVETLGSTTVICSDKTGTLTKNEMTVRELWSAGQHLTTTGSGYDPEGDFFLQEKPTNISNMPSVLETLTAGLLCNDSNLHAPNSLNDGNMQWSITGDPTEAALIAATIKADIKREAVSCERLDTIPFQSEYQYMATLNVRDSQHMIFLKGSLESLLPRCVSMLDESGNPQKMDMSLIEQQAEQMAARGLRVLAFARKRVANDVDTINHSNVEGEMEFLGLQAMIDPPRPEAIKAVAACHQAGIDVKMITGDHALTAGTIARQLGIVGDNSTSLSVTGAQLATMTPSEFVAAALKYKVFARVTPENKLQLVKALQSEGHVVAMTGDGVNDAPALRRADIGVAMAMNGTEVAREAADMMLIDDNFATIPDAIEEGRGVFDNLKKFIVWTLPTNGGEGLVILLAVMLGVSLPLLPIHILWVNMTTAIFLGLMLAFEPREEGIMRRPPNQPNTPIIDATLVWRIILVSTLLCLTSFGLYEFELSLGASQEEARTVAVAMFVVGEAFYLLNCRSLKRSCFAVGINSNSWIWVGIGIMMFLQLLFTYVPIMNSWFSSAPISAQAWLRVFGGGLLIFALVGLEKHWRFRNRSHHSNTLSLAED
ncbi:cation-transporting P-type ATPase [Paraglaciecola sp. MB-3u-78]|uniref:cation-transporting P-type ATPase n=1 Tax=Paraglaciecola sp. MB-3u-78 TaxID=2058332 RepID=UPI000C34F9CB|nr:cation-transporting P-type ATPase [Paraglaciecola sp. MB-3u-78]PKH00220.1 carbonate dehydratase [Paraglaciecola sp. MB-3u-78]